MIKWHLIPKAVRNEISDTARWYAHAKGSAEQVQAMVDRLEENTYEDEVLAFNIEGAITPGPYELCGMPELRYGGRFDNRRLWVQLWGVLAFDVEFARLIPLTPGAAEALDEMRAMVNDPRFWVEAKR